jgi:sodium-dependent dicarboxylate transporter 2/3/5
MIRDQAGVDISFVEWMAFAGPISVVMVGFLVLYMNWIGATGMREIQGAERIIHERKAALGPWKRGEKNALIAFLVTVGLWLTSGILPRLLGADHPVAAFISGALPTAVPAIIGAVLLFLMPVSPTQRSTISWDEAARIDWGTILLFGGGLSLGSMAGTTGLAEAFGNGITGVVPVSSLVALTVASAVFATVFSETMSNTAAATIAIPIIISIAQAAGTNPVPPAVAASLAASVAVILPVSTPPNAIVFSTGKVPLTKMVRYGVAMDIVAVIVIPVVVLLFLA